LLRRPLTSNNSFGPPTRVGLDINKLGSAAGCSLGTRGNIPVNEILKKRLINPLLVPAIVVLYFVARLWQAGNVDKISLILIALAGAFLPIVIALVAVRAASKSTDRTGA